MEAVRCLPKHVWIRSFAGGPTMLERLLKTLTFPLSLSLHAPLRSRVINFAAGNMCAHVYASVCACMCVYP